MPGSPYEYIVLHKSQMSSTQRDRLPTTVPQPFPSPLPQADGRNKIEASIGSAVVKVYDRGASASISSWGLELCPCCQRGKHASSVEEKDGGCRFSVVGRHPSAPPRESTQARGRVKMRELRRAQLEWAQATTPKWPQASVRRHRRPSLRRSRRSHSRQGRRPLPKPRPRL